MILESRNLGSALGTNPCQSSAERSSAFSIVSIIRSEHLDIVSASVIRKCCVAQKEMSEATPH